MGAILEAVNISKKFGKFYALKGVDFSVYPGEVNVLIGENGAGKSTLLKIISGVYTKDKGEILFENAPVTIHSPKEAERLGISTVYQELSLVPELSIAENVFLGSDLPTNSLGYVSWKSLFRESEQILRDVVGMDVDTRQPVKSLGIAQQQMVEIARAVHRNGKVLILDEPTAVLTQKEVVKLFEVIETLKERGIAIIYISHRLEEIFQIGTRVTVLRDGMLVGKAFVKEITTDRLINLMVGRSIDQQFPKMDFSGLEKREVLRVENLSRKDAFQDISFSVRTGEILGLAGLVGAGRTEIARCIFGADHADHGKLFLDGKEVTIKNTRQAVRSGIALLPENRKEQGLVIKHSVRQNISIVNIDKILTRMKSLSRKKEWEAATQYVDRLRIAVQDIENPVSSLSGGNQQKVVIAKWMFADARIVIFDEPTRGIDVGAKTEVYNLINQLVMQNKAVVIISSEMPELMGLCDRILTIKNGAVTGEFLARDTYQQDELLKAMMVG